MINDIQEEKLIDSINLLLEKYNIKVVDLTILSYKKESKFKVVIFSDNNLNHDLMEKVHWKIDKIIEDAKYRDYTIELSSPGINRIFKNDKEYNIFKNKKLKLILKENKIVEGINRGLKGNIVEIINNDKSMLVDIDNIIKAKLA